ncbi:MAG: Ldh family oxidoreductase [Thermodesulfobacteriota bacterium]
MPNLQAEEIEKIAFHLLCAAGAPEEHSQIVAQHLMDNNLAGHDSHGIIRIIQYLRQIKEGVIIPQAKPEIIFEAASTAQVDGHYGFGQVAAKFSTELAIKKAKEQGVSCVSVRNLGHIGRLGAYTEMAAEAGCAAILFCGTGGQVPYQAPFGGTQRKLGTNPIAIAFPGMTEEIFSSDFATSVCAEGKLRVYLARGSKVPEGWILDKDGRPSINPKDFYDGGTILPLGGSVGHKGYCLAFMTDLLASVLSGNGFPGKPNRQFSNGSLIIVIDIEKFVPLTTAMKEASLMANFIKDTPLAEGFTQVYYPGEKETISRRRRRQEGIEIEEETWRQIKNLIQEYKVTEKLNM